MNRRSFLAGLLATTAAVPLAKVSPYAADMGIDLAAGPDTSALMVLEGNPGGYSWVRSALWFAVTDRRSLFLREVQDFMRWGPEATDVTLDQWDTMRDLLDRAPVPDGELLYGGPAGGDMTDAIAFAMLPASSEAKHATPKPNRRT